MAAPQGTDTQVGARFALRHFVPGVIMNIFRRVKSVSGFVAKRPRERTANMDQSGQTVGGINARADIQPKFDYEPDVDSIIPFRAHHNGKYEITGPLGTTDGTGTITTDGTDEIVGDGTAFTTELVVGDYIFITGETARRITVITDDENATLDSAADTTDDTLTFSYASAAAYQWDFAPKEFGDDEPAAFIGAMDFEITDGDGYPIFLHEAAQQDLEIKIADGKITSITESWFACRDSYMSEAEVVKTASTYTGSPSIYGHLGAAAKAAMPLRMKVTAGAGSGHDLQAKFALALASLGTVTTNGTTAVVGVGTTFTNYQVGDSIYITGETPRTISVITDNTHITLNAAAATTAAGVAYEAARFSGTAIDVLFDVPFKARLGSGARVGISRYEEVWVIFPAGFGTASANDEYSFTTPRPLATASYSPRNVLHAAGFEVTIDGVPFGGVPGRPGFHGCTIKLTRPRKQNFTSGSKYSEGNQRNGRIMATISFDRDREDRAMLEKLISAASVAITVSMYGDPFGDTGLDEFWGFTFANCEVGDDQRDVATENTLPEKIDLTAVRGVGGTPIYTERVLCGLSGLPSAA
jgi:hypothetical protein